MRSPFGEVLAALDRAFEAVGIRWYLFGAQAALLYGSTRLTADVDVTVDLCGMETAQLARRLDTEGFTLRITEPGFVERTRVLPVVHPATGIAADIVIAGPGLEELFLSRAQVCDVGGARVPVARAEDVVAMKLLAGRSKDLDDVVAILAARADLDLDLLRATLSLLESALDQSDLTPALAAALERARGGSKLRPTKAPASISRTKKRRRPKSR